MGEREDDPIARRAAALATMVKEFEQAKDRPRHKRDAATDSSAFVVMSVKARRAEIDEFKALCARLGAPPNRAMRALIREASGCIELFDEDRTSIAELERQFRAISAASECIARVAEETGHLDAAELDRWRRHVDARTDPLRTAMGTILNVAASRADGAKRLSRSVAALEKADPSRRGTGQQRKSVGVTGTRSETTLSTSRTGEDAAGNAHREVQPDAEPARTGLKLRRTRYPYVHPNKQHE